MKKALSLFMSIVMLISITSGMDMIASALTSEDFEYNVLDDGTAEITKYTGSATDVTIPSVIDGYTVTSISSAFYNFTSLISIIIPESVIEIGSVAFSGCINLESVVIPNSVKYIVSSAFKNCTKLASITIGDGVTEIGVNAFYNTAYYNDSSNWENNVLYLNNYLIKAETSLTGNYIIRENTKVIAACAFDGCTSLESVIIPDSITRIDGFTFYDCKKLANITIGNSVTDIGANAFYNTSYYNNSSNWENNVLYLDNYLIRAKTSLSGNYTIRDNTKVIAYSAFGECESITDVTIPNSVTSIAGSVFDSCSSLTSITIPNSVTSIGDHAFDRCSSLTSVTIPDSVTSIGYCAFGECSSLTSIAIPNSVTSIGDNAFHSCSSLTSVTISNSVTSIGYLAFGECSSLTSIAIPNSVTSIGDSAFYSCSSLTSVTIPNSVTSVGNYAFDSCSSLTNITIPNSVTSIGNHAFYGCTSLMCVFYKGTENEWSEISVSGFYSDLEEVNIHCNSIDSDGYFSVIVQPTCVKQGYILNECSVCSSSYKSDYTKKLGHIFTNYTSDNNATCIEDGTKTAKCDRCDVTDTIFVENTALGHSFTNYVSNNNATCTSNATETAICDRADCNEKDTREIPNSALNHDWTAATCTAPKTCNRCDVTDGEALGHDWAAATCTAPKTCTRCGKTEGSKLGHIFTNYVSNDNATCTTNATETAICDREDCNETDTREIPNSALNHDWTAATCATPKTCNRCDAIEGTALGHDWAAATCTSPKTCNRCGKTEGSKLGHIFTNYVSNDNATCTTNATETAICDREDCNETDTREIPNSALNHDWTAATCTAPKTCNRCDVTDGEALGHDWAAATCTAPKTCNRCDVTDGEALGHDWADATCTAPKTCNTCGTTEGEALGHSFTNYVSNDDATCTTNATETAICDREDCNETDTREIPNSALNHDWTTATCTSPKTCNTCGATEGAPLGHSYAATVVPATCTAQGYTIYTCSCGDSYNADYSDALGHNFGENNATCAVCGASNPNYVAPTPIDPTPTQPTTPTKPTKPSQPTTQAPAANQPTAQVQETTAIQSEATSTTVTETEATTANPKATSIKKLTKGKKSFKATWKKLTGVNGYQVQYSTDKKFKKNTKTVTIKKNTASATIKKLKANKKYYVRVRSYKNAKVGGKTVKVYSSWSKVKTVTTKK